LGKASQHVSAPQDIPLDPKATPLQGRARDTFDAILRVAGELLAESGFEQLTTNKICQRAGVSPPALYRYFPNKYAILNEMADRLMNRQDEAVLAWLEAGGAEMATLDESIAASFEIQTRIIEITRDQPGGVSVTRAIRGIPLLHETRLKSRDRMADALFMRLRKRSNKASDEDLRIAARISLELTYAALEMIVGEPGPDDEKLTHEASVMVSLYLERFR
jgi:AcrR family transcriptional regulator